MNRPLYLALVAWLLPAALCATFDNPNSLPSNGYPPALDADFSRNPIYTEGSDLSIQWSKGEEKIPTSITLYQINLPKPGDESEGFQHLILPMEYIIQSVVDRTSFTWVVKTGHDLSESNVFMMSLFQEGETTGSSNSQYFNISSGRNDEISESSSSISSISSSSSSSFTSTSSSASSSATSSVLLTPTNVSQPPSAKTTALPGETTSAAASPSASAPAASKGLSTGTIIGIGVGVGIPAILALGVGLGFLLFRRRKQNDTIPPLINDAQQGEQYSNDYQNYYDKGATLHMDTHELPHYRQDVELETNRPPVHELDSGWRVR